MIDPKILQALSKQFIEKPPPVFKTLHAEAETTFKTVIQSAFTQMNIVSREEFEAQCVLLAKNKLKLEALHTEMVVLNEKIAKIETS